MCARVCVCVKVKTEQVDPQPQQHYPAVPATQDHSDRIASRKKLVDQREMMKKAVERATHETVKARYAALRFQVSFLLYDGQLIKSMVSS